MLCKCGCKTEIPEKDKRGRLRFFVHGHTNKGKSNFWKTKPVIKERTSHERAVKLCNESKCRINNKDCKGRLDVAHLDGNNLNNAKDNLAKLCRAHHFILDKHKLTLEQLRNLELKYTVSSNKRRYEW